MLELKHIYFNAGRLPEKLYCFGSTLVSLITLSFVSQSRRHLERITSVGPRPVGSQENEVLTVGYLLEQIEHIQQETAAGPHQLTVDVQRPTGSFSIDFLGGFTSFYDRVTNIAVRLEPKGGAQHLMLANCHFDTVANSPGQKETLLFLSC